MKAMPRSARGSLATPCAETGGVDGQQVIPRNPLVFGYLSLESDTTLYYLTLTFLLASLWFLWRVVSSPFEQVLKDIRDNEARAISLGYASGGTRWVSSYYLPHLRDWQVR